MVVKLARLSDSTMFLEAGLYLNMRRKFPHSHIFSMFKAGSFVHPDNWVFGRPIRDSLYSFNSWASLQYQSDI